MTAVVASILSGVLLTACVSIRDDGPSLEDIDARLLVEVDERSIEGIDGPLVAEVDGRRYGVPPGTGFWVLSPSRFVDGDAVQESVDRARAASPMEPTMAFRSIPAKGKPSFTFIDARGKRFITVSETLEMAKNAIYVAGVARLPRSPFPRLPEVPTFAVRTGLDDAPLAIATCDNPIARVPDTCVVSADLPGGLHLLIHGLVAEWANPSALREAIVSALNTALPD